MTAAPALRLRPGEAHVWVARPDEACGLGTLTADELARCLRIRPLQPRRAYAAAHALVRHALNWCVPAVTPSSWHLAPAAPHGRPEIRDPRLPERLRVNLSHTDGLVAVVTTLGPPCGVDVEVRPSAITARRLSARILSAAELADWRALPEPSRADRFCHLWTLKEATTKALGRGLEIPFDTVSFAVGHRGRADRLGEDRPWSTRSWRPTSRHHLSVAVPAPDITFVRHDLQEETYA